MNRDTIIACLSDMHSGGSTALFPHYNKLQPNGFWQFKNARYVPSGRQCDMFDHFERSADSVYKLRDNKRLIVIHDGDAIDGIHHETHQLATRIYSEQIDVHLWLMNFFLKRTNYDHSSGDLIYYISGTETHTKDTEDEIAEQLNAERRPDGQSWDFLPLEVNGKLIWVLHHGSAAGKSFSEGDALRNWLKRIYWQCIKDKIRPPDVVISGHVHTPAYSTYVQDYHTIHGIILPSWQAKTRYAYMVAPVDVNKVGLHTLEIKADGVIVVHKPDLLNQREESVIV